MKYFYQPGFPVFGPNLKETLINFIYPPQHQKSRTEPGNQKIILVDSRGMTPRTLGRRNDAKTLINAQKRKTLSLQTPPLFKKTAVHSYQLYIYTTSKPTTSLVMNPGKFGTSK